MKLALITLLFSGIYLATTDSYARQGSGLPSISAITQSRTDSGEVLEILPTREYLQFSPVDPVDRELLQWDEASGKNLYVAKNKQPFLYLIGQLKPGYEVSLDDQWIPVKKNGYFEFKVNIPLRPTGMWLKIFDPERKFSAYRMLNIWLKIPPTLSIKVKDDTQQNEVLEKSLGFSGKIRKSGFVQLYADNQPITTLDIDQQRHANLSFRIYPPPETEKSYDRWKLTIWNKDKKIAGELNRYGSPPSFVDWKEVGDNILEGGDYTYAVTLYRENEEIDGPVNEFNAFESISLVEHSYRPLIAFEPRQELGYFSYSGPGHKTNNLYVGGELQFVLWSRLLLRGTGYISYHTLDPESFFTFTRLGAGFRLYAAGEDSVLGTPHFARFDILLSQTGFTVNPSAKIKRFSQGAILFEPHLVLWRYHYIVPSLEIGLGTNPTSIRLNSSLAYYFYIRPWSLKFGMGLAYEDFNRGIDKNRYEGDFHMFRAFSALIFTI